MMSNDYTFDKTMAISKKINEIRGLLKELNNDNSTFLTESFDVCNESLDLLESEILPYYQPLMPPLENGMFGIVKHLYNNTFVPFCVVNDFIVYAEESWDDVKTFDIYGKSEYSEIIRLYKDVRSFDFTKVLFERGNTEKLVWSSKED